MKLQTKIIISFFVLILLICNHLHANQIPATIQIDESGANKTWSMENGALKVQFSFLSTGTITFTSFYNKAASVEYLKGMGTPSLFSYQGHLAATDRAKAGLLSTIKFDYQATQTGWQYNGYSQEDIEMNTLTGKQTLGKKLKMNFSKDSIGVTIVAELYDGVSGLRLQNLIKNNCHAYKMIVEESTVIRLNFPNLPHNLHYVSNTKWVSTPGGVNEAALYNKGKDVAKDFINLYDTNDGWYIAPEVNWKTQHGPETPSSSYEYMHRSFAGLTAWSENASNYVQVNTNPESFQLVLFPEEEFEYIAINLTTFKGDIVDGKMAVEEHLRKRYRYHDIKTIFDINDWDWFTQGKRTESFYKNVVIPKALETGIDMVMFDDGWNNPNSTNTGLNNNGTLRDNVECSPMITTDFKSFTDYIHDKGLMFGLWYSMSGGNHNQGFDLSDPDFITAKKSKVQFLIDNHHMSHQMVDLTELWQGMNETDYSHPSDNVYRKVVRMRNALNEIVEANPTYLPKVTSELDIYPTQGDRGVELIHIPNNGWLTAVGNAGGGAWGIISYTFGHYPMNSIYFGGTPTGSMEEYYTLMAARNIKFGTCPDTWTDNGIKTLAFFNKWRKNARISELTSKIERPVFLGDNWDNKDASKWAFATAPFFWLYTNEERSGALLIGTTEGQVGKIGDFSLPVRWMDSQKTYLVEDITLDDTMIHTYHYRGKHTGSQLLTDGLTVNMYENFSRGKVYWIQELKDVPYQVLYADENVDSYTESSAIGQLAIEATGVPLSKGIIVVYGKKEDKTMLKEVVFNSEGKAIFAVSYLEEPEEVDFPGFRGSLRYDLEDYNDFVIKSNSTLVVNTVYNGTPDSEGGNS